MNNLEIIVSSDKTEIPDASVVELMHCAYKAREDAYCPYSDFHVGAAVLCQDGTIVTGNRSKINSLFF